MNLQTNDCLLLLDSEKQDLVNRFNELVAKLGTLQETVKGQENYSQFIKSYETRLNNIRSIMTRKYYRVGFLGMTAAGKSTTFNNILKVTNEDAPAQSGGGGATTAAPSRLRRSQGDTPTLLLNFMTEDNYEKRKQDLATHMDLGGLNEDEILQKCNEFKNHIYEHGIPFQRNANIDNIIPLESLILSKRKYPDRVVLGKKRHTKEADYQDRSIYLNHSIQPNDGIRKPDIAENRLLWEVEINLPNKVLPNNLEMLDLPGLGATRHIDTCVTRDIIQNPGEERLDGALIFINSGTLGDNNVPMALTDLQSAWQNRFRGRVWAVCTKFESLTTYHYSNKDPKTNFFPEIKRISDQYDIPDDCVFFVSNTVYNAINEAASKNNIEEKERIEIATKKTQTGYEPTSQIYQDIFASFPGFSEAIRQFYLNGGIDYLRSAIVDRLSRMIGKEVADDVRKQIGSAGSEIDSRINTAKRSNSQTEIDRKNANVCQGKVRGILIDVKSGMKEFETVTRDLRLGMKNKAQEITHVEDLGQIQIHEIKDCFGPLARNLDEQTKNLFTDKCVETVYRTIENHLACLPQFPICQADSIQEAWANWKKEDAEYSNWENEIPKFYNKSIIEEVVKDLQPLGFKTIVENKMDAVTLISMFRLKERVKKHLQKMNDELLLLSSPGQVN